MRRTSLARIVSPFILAAALALPRALEAHDFQIMETLLVLKSSGHFQADLICDLDALALGVSPTTDNEANAAALRALDEAEMRSRVDRLGETFARRVRVRFDGEPAPFAVSFPEYEGLERHAISGPSLLGITARLTGEIPGDSAAVSFFASRAFGPTQLTILDERDLSGHRVVLQPGEESPPWQPGQGEKQGGGLGVAARYAVLGFQHILPAGLDHVLFVLGLFLLSARWRPLLWQVTAFTVAHTATLALSGLGVVRLSPGVVEPLVALSIAWIAIENLFTERLHPWRPAVVFAFGLLHGLGFAGVLGELGLPEGERITALLAFNLGVEAGQITVLAAAFLALGLWRERAWYRSRLAIPASLAIAAVGLYWAATRVLG
jgi:hypothetical protein